MLNLYDTLRTSLQFRKFEVGDLLFVSYSCPLEEKSFRIWTQSDYLIYVLSGKKTWYTPEGSWTAEKNQCYYLRKGAYVIEQFFEEEFCMLMFFISDPFIRDFISEEPGHIRRMQTCC